MYFSEQGPLCSPQEIHAQSLGHLQTIFTAEQSAFQLPRIFEVINNAYASEEDLANYALGFHPNSRLVASLQAQTYARPAAAKILAESIDPADTFFSEEALQHARNGTATSYSSRREFGGSYFSLSTPVRPDPVAYPCGMDVATWQALAKARPGAIVDSVRKHHEETGAQPESDILQAGLRMVCAKKTRVSRVLIATAPTRTQNAHRVLQEAGAFYSRGITAISGALERSNYIDEWDHWRFLAHRKEDTSDNQDHTLSPEQWQLVRTHGVSLAIRNKRPTTALKIINDAMHPHIQQNLTGAGNKEQEYNPPTQEPSYTIVNALATLVFENQT